jgi:hypothetical protein
LSIPVISLVEVLWHPAIAKVRTDAIIKPENRTDLKVDRLPRYEVISTE